MDEINIFEGILAIFSIGTFAGILLGALLHALKVERII